MFARNLKNMRMHLLLDGNGLGQVAGEVDIEVAGDGEPVGNELQRNDIEETLENIDVLGELDLDALLASKLLVTLVADNNGLAATSNDCKI